MKISLALGPRRALDRANAWGCFTTNTFVLPGLGSLVAGRRTGYAQAAFALVGVVCSGLFAVWFFPAWFHLNPMPDDVDTWLHLIRAWRPWLLLGAVGFGSFGIGWLWALGSSLAILAEARPAVPPPAAP